jgi:hypothetical protein
LWGSEWLQRPEELAGCGSNGRNDDGVHTPILDPAERPEPRDQSLETRA